MAYCNVNQFTAKRLAKIRNIANCDQVERNFKSSAYLAWNNVELFSEEPRSDGLKSFPFPEKNAERKNRNKNRRKSHKDSLSSTLDTGLPSEVDFDLAMIPG